MSNIERIKDHMPVAKVMHIIRNRKLKNRDFTLLAPNCWGGYIISYHGAKIQFADYQYANQYYKGFYEIPEKYRLLSCAANSICR